MIIQRSAASGGASANATSCRTAPAGAQQAIATKRPRAYATCAAALATPSAAVPSASQRRSAAASACVAGGAPGVASATSGAAPIARNAPAMSVAPPKPPSAEPASARNGRFAGLFRAREQREQGLARRSRRWRSR